MINNAEDAKRAVADCKYPPGGMRSHAPTRAMIHGGPDYGQKANDVAIGAYTHSAEFAVEFWRRGFHMVDLLSDGGFLAQGVGEVLAAINEARSGTPATTPETY